MKKGYITTTDIGAWSTSTSASQLFNAFFFFIFAWAVKGVGNIFLLPEKWFGLQHDTCTEWHFIFWFLFGTDKPRGSGGHSSTWGIETPSGLALARRQAWCSICPIRDLQTPQCIRAVSTAFPESIANRGASLRFQSLILGFAGSNNPLSLKRGKKREGLSF